MEDGSGNWLSHVDFTVTESTGEGSADNGETVSTMTDLKALTDKTKLNPSDSNQTSNSEDALIEKLKKQLQEIEAKLRRTDNEGEKVKLEGEKTALTARILQIEKRASQPV
jgi:molecular chaperone GrpE (heat shock protein)